MNITNIDLTPLFQVLISLFAAFITYRLIPWIKTNTTTAQQTQLRAAVKVAVYAAEQIYGAAHGKEKLDYAFNWLRQQGYDVNREEIEAAVYELLNDSMLSIDTVNLNQGVTAVVKATTPAN